MPRLLSALGLLFIASLQHGALAKNPGPNKQIKEWMAIEKEFQKLDEELEGALGEDFSSFRHFMNDKIKVHHAAGKDCLKGPYAELQAKSTSYDECSGRGSLTESESILHEALDHFMDGKEDKSVGKKEIHRLHQLAHGVFSKTRRMLQDMSLLQSSEFDPDVLKKREQLVQMYKRED